MRRICSCWVLVGHGLFCSLQFSSKCLFVRSFILIFSGQVATASGVLKSIVNDTDRARRRMRERGGNSPVKDSILNPVDSLLDRILRKELASDKRRNKAG